MSLFWLMAFALLVFFIAYDPCKGNLHHYFIHDIPAPPVAPMIKKDTAQQQHTLTYNERQLI